MSSLRKRQIDWSRQDGAKDTPRRLCLKPSGEGVFLCPIDDCDHDGFRSQRGCRKHVKIIHAWYMYFDEKPRKVRRATENVPDQNGRRDTQHQPCFSMNCPAGEPFAKWLRGSTGGGRSSIQAGQTAKRALKYLKFCCDQQDEEELTEDTMHYCLGSPTLLCEFVEEMEARWKLSPSGQSGFLSAISELMDYCKAKRLPASVLSDFTVMEVYLKKAKRSIGKRMRARWAEELDVERLDERGRWASMQELSCVIPYHLPRFKAVAEKCRDTQDRAMPGELCFATSFLTTYLFLSVKCSRPMTYQYLTLDMVEAAERNSGFVDQKTFKTAENYGFDSFLLDETSLQLIRLYVRLVRPLLNPTCEYVLVTRRGTQHTKLGNLMSKLVHQATGKHVHPTRFRQIVETESARRLDVNEQQTVSLDQKHSSRVAKLHYQKQRSREVAEKAKVCMEKLRGESEANVRHSIRTTLEFDRPQCERTDDEPRTVIQISADEEEEKEREEDDDEDEEKERKMEMTAEKTKAGASEAAGSEGAEAENKGEGDGVARFVSRTNRTRREPLRFTSREDRYLKKGIQRYGFGRWTAMLRDPELAFAKERTVDSIMKRAMSRFRSVKKRLR